MEFGSDSEEELFPIVNNQYTSSNNGVFRYDDPLLVSGVLKAVLEEDLNKIKYLIESGKSVNINDNNGNTPLHVAVIKNNLEIIDYILSRDDLVVNVRNFRGETPLLQAVRNGRFESAKKLVQSGANVNLPNHEEVTPLHVSVRYPDLAHMLILNGARIDAVDYSGDSPLHDAVAEDCLETVCMLLYYNADANAYGGNDLTPFMKAIISENIEIQHALFEYVDDFNTATTDHMTTLALALTHDTPYVEEIINRGADVNYANLYEDDLSGAFFLCLRVPNDQNFTLIWDKLNYNELINSIDLVTLFDFLDDVILRKYIEVITESNNIKTAIESFSKNKNFHDFIAKFAEHNLNLELLTKLTSHLILYGYRPTSHDISEIFSHYGYCELFKILLYMDNNCNWKWLPRMVLPRLIFEVDSGPIDLRELYENIRIISQSEIEILFEYCTCHKLLQSYKEYFKDVHLPSLTDIPKVPSLVEVARNKAREHIANTYKTTSTSQFYTIINHLNIATAYKKILTFETKLYYITNFT